MRLLHILLGGLAYLLLVHPSASTRRPMSMMPRFSERERKRERGEREKRERGERKKRESDDEKRERES